MGDGISHGEMMGDDGGMVRLMVMRMVMVMVMVTVTVTVTVTCIP